VTARDVTTKSIDHRGISYCQERARNGKIEIYATEATGRDYSKLYERDAPVNPEK